MSTPRKLRRQLIASLRQRSRTLVDTLVAANDLPEFDPTSIRPWALGCPDHTDPGRPPLGWHVDLIEPAGASFVLLVDVLTRPDVDRVWTWLLWRTQARAEAACPAWLMVCVTDDAVLSAVRKAFDHEPANLPMLIDADAKVLALPSRPAPRPPVSFFV